MRFLFDTNAYVAFAKGDERLTSLVFQATVLLFSPVVAGELFRGFEEGSLRQENRQALSEFLSKPKVAVLILTLGTAQHYGHISARLRAKGRPIPTNDIWIAAHAMESGAQLVTFDKHFDDIDGLAVVHPE